MDEDTIRDLKQFIATTVSQQTFGIRDEIISVVSGDIKKLDEKLSNKIDSLSESVAQALETANESTDSQLKDHEQRLNKLQHRVA